MRNRKKLVLFLLAPALFFVALGGVRARPHPDARQGRKPELPALLRGAGSEAKDAVGVGFTQRRTRHQHVHRRRPRGAAHGQGAGPVHLVVHLPDEGPHRPGPRRRHDRPVGQAQGRVSPGPAGRVHLQRQGVRLRRRGGVLGRLVQQGRLRQVQPEGPHHLGRVPQGLRHPEEERRHPHAADRPGSAGRPSSCSRRWSPARIPSSTSTSAKARSSTPTRA